MFPIKHFLLYLVIAVVVFIAKKGLKNTLNLSLGFEEENVDDKTSYQTFSLKLGVSCPCQGQIEQNVPEEKEEPLCLELPEGKIIQCRNGQPIPQKYSSNSLEVCPNSKEGPFGGDMRMLQVGSLRDLIERLTALCKWWQNGGVKGGRRIGRKTTDFSTQLDSSIKFRPTGGGGGGGGVCRNAGYNFWNLVSFKLSDQGFQMQ